MARVVYAIILGLIGAGIVHIAVLLLVPSFAERDAWSRVRELAGFNTMVRLRTADPQLGILATADPLFDAAACRFDLSEGPAHIVAEGKVPYWSLSLYDRRGQNVYSINDRTATGGLLDVVVATPVQLIELRKAMPPEFETAVFVETDLGEAMLVVRAFVPDPTWKKSVTDWLGIIACTTDS